MRVGGPLEAAARGPQGRALNCCAGPPGSGRCQGAQLQFQEIFQVHVSQAEVQARRWRW